MLSVNFPRTCAGVVVADCTRIMAGDVDGGLHVVANTETEEDGPEWQLVATCKVTCST